MDLLKKSSGTTGDLSSVVTLNVGGKLYTASLATLARFPKSKLATMFINGSRPQSVGATDSDGNVFIDRDGELFRFILNFLRSSKLLLPVGFSEIEQLKQEAEFYQIKELSAVLQAKRDDTSTIFGANKEVRFEHIEVVARPRFVEVFGSRKTMEECFQKSTFSSYVSLECTTTTEGTANLEIKVTNRRGDYVGNEPKTTVMNALGTHGFNVVSASHLQDPKNPAVMKEIIILTRKIRH